MKPSMLIVDDHPMLLAGLREALADDYRIEYASSVPIAEMMLVSDRFDIVLFDFYLGQHTSIELMRLVRQRYAGTRLCLITQEISGAIVEICAPYAPDAIFEKSLPSNVVRDEIQRVYAGGHYYDSKVVHELFRMVGSGVHASESRNQPRLSEEEMAVLRLTADGKTAKEIAEALNISVATVNLIRRDVKNTLGIATLAELIAYVHDHGHVM